MRNERSNVRWRVGGGEKSQRLGEARVPAEVVCARPYCTRKNMKPEVPGRNRAQSNTFSPSAAASRGVAASAVARTSPSPRGTRWKCEGSLTGPRWRLVFRRQTRHPRRTPAPGQHLNGKLVRTPHKVRPTVADVFTRPGARRLTRALSVTKLKHLNKLHET